MSDRMWVFRSVIEAHRMDWMIEKMESIGYWDDKVPRVIMKRWWI